jgi:hypothetical protein
MFAFWAGAVAALSGIMFALLRSLARSEKSTVAGEKQLQCAYARH